MQMKKGKWDLNNIWVVGGGGMKEKQANQSKPKQANQTKPKQAKPSQENIQFFSF
jgi:hypothetical protein